MKLHLIYFTIGIATLVLNLILSLHVIRRHNSTSRKPVIGCEDIITFSLKGEERNERDTTEAVLCDDTVALQ